jgi:hypothetical protein
VDRDREHALRGFLPNHIFFELGDDFAWRGDPREELFARAATFAFLVEDRLAELDTLAADVDVARSFDQRPDVTVALATLRTESVLLRGPAAASPRDIPG